MSYIYVDSSQHTDIELGKLMHDFRCKNPNDMGDSVLANRVRVLKETEEGVEMCREMEEIYNEGINVGKMEEKISTAKAMAKDGLSIERIARILKVSVETVEKWLSKSVTPAC